MKESLKSFLFTKHILVNDNSEGLENNFEALFSMANILNIKVTKGQELATLGIFQFAAAKLGKRVPKPFYEGFPESVKKLTPEELLFDQLVHYTVTYGFGNFSEAGHSLLEEHFDRIAFREKTQIKEFIIISEDNAKEELQEILDNLLSSTRPLSKEQFEVVETIINDYGVEITKCECKETAIKLMINSGNEKFANFLHLSDFINIVEILNFERNRKKSIKKLNLKNQDRKFLTKVLDVFLSNDFYVKDCYEKQALWCGVLHHLHYKPKNEKAKEFIDAMRSGENKSVSSLFEKEIAVGDVKKAIDVLLKYKGNGIVLRNLNYIISRCKDEDEINYILDNLNLKANNILIIQNLIQYYHYKKAEPRNFKFTKFNRLIVHQETQEEVERRKSMISEENSKKLFKIFKEQLKENLKGKLGKVYIEEGMENIALPIQETTAMGGYGTLPKGSRLKIKDGKKIRAFVYWEKVNDIDLSAMGLTKDLVRKEFSWRTMFSEQSDYFTFSGDQTSGYDGGSEYFDIIIEEFKKKNKDIKYLIFSANVFSGKPFSECICRSGYMTRDLKDSGEVYEPKTVETAFDINCESTMAYLFAINLKTRELVWLNMAKDSSAIIAGTTGFDFILDYMDLCDIINYKRFFEMLATEVVDTPEEADVIVSDKTYETKEGVEVIHSYDIDKVLKWLNEK